MSIMFASSHGQDCSPTTLLQKPGDWKEGLNGSVSGIPATDLAREKNVVTSLHTMLKSKYIPMGVSADFNGAYNSPESSIPVNGYSYNIIPLNYYCEGSIVKIADAASTYFSITVNYFDAEIYETAQGDRALAEGFNVMTTMPVEKDGYYQFKEKAGTSGKSGRWLVTYSGKLPYAYVSKKEFLEKREQILSDQMSNASSGFKNVLKNIEIEKSYKEKEYKNDAAKLQRYLKMDYQSTKDRYEKLLAENERTFKPAFVKVESLLKMPAAELSQPAIIKQDPNDHLSYLFTEDEDPFARILIKPNPAYFNKTLPRSSPQFFSVYIIGSPKDPIAATAMRDITKAVDFVKLKNMLGK